MNPDSPIPLLDLHAQNGPLEAELLEACARVLKSQRFILGPEVKALEQALAAYCGAKEAVGVSSGTDALIAALHALGIGPGDEVVTTPLSFFASVGAIRAVGATPAFADVEPDTLTLDAREIAKALTPRTRAVLPVHLFGQSADMDGILEVARRHDLWVIEDGAQAIGATHRGARVGTLGHAGCFSFFPGKNLGGFGDGGFVTTNNPELAERLRRTRNHGFREKHVSVEPGGNYRLDELQAALLRVKLPHLETWNEQRRANAARYRALLDLYVEPLRSGWSWPADATNRRHVFNQFVIQCPERDQLAQYLDSHGIRTAVYYPLALHLQPVLANLGYEVGQFPIAEAACRDGLALPMYAELSERAIEHVAERVGAFAKSASRHALEGSQPEPTITKAPAPR